MKQVFESVRQIEESILDLFSPDKNIAEFLMIENAASALEKLVKKQFKKAKNKKNNSILVMCGSGNNGADGYTLARHLAGFCDIYLLQVKEPKSFFCITSFENLKPLLKKQIELLTLKSEVKNTKLEKIINNSTIIVDCIFGTGFHDLVEEKIQNLFKIVNHSNAIKIACDIPSGLCANTKNIASFSLQHKKHCVFCADITLTMGAYKTTLFYDDAKDLVGKILYAPIGISKELFLLNAKKVFSENKIYLLEKKDLILPIRKEQNVHKGSFGHTSVIAGQKLGASILASSAAFKVGSGLSSIVQLCKENNEDIFNFKIPASIMILQKISDNITSLVLGPGLGQNIECSIIQQYFNFITEKKISIVLDAESFYYEQTYLFLDNILKLEKNESNKIQHKIILTPHPKEFAKILQMTGFGEFSIDEIKTQKIELLRAFCSKYKNIVLVLKGANTFICQKNKIYICNVGTQALAKGGSGDVLAGIIAGLLAQKYDALDAAISGVLMHALASCKFKNGYFLTPEDLIEKLF